MNAALAIIHSMQPQCELQDMLCGAALWAEGLAVL
jgi:hypothetical protein